jgi:hypothetical protein
VASYVVLLFAVVWWFQTNAPRGAVKYVAAVLPALPLLAVIWALGMYLVDETDEYIRMRTVRACLIATGLVLAAATAWGFLEQFEAVPHLPLYYVFVVWCAFFGLAQVVNRLLDR